MKKNIYILVGLVIFLILMLNYNNIINFFKIYEGNTDKRTDETIQAEIDNELNNFLSDKMSGSDEKITLKEFLTDEIKGKLKKIFNLTKELNNYVIFDRTGKNISTMNEYAKHIESEKKTPTSFKNYLMENFFFGSLGAHILSLYKELGIDLYAELETETSITDGNLVNKISIF